MKPAKSISGSTGFFDSKKDSDIALIFIPGSFNSRIWKHQVNYFSKKYRTFSFNSRGTPESEIDTVERIIDETDIKNFVVISNALSAGVAAQIVEIGDVVGGIFSNILDRDSFHTRKSVYRTGKSLINQPKLLKKIVFSDKSRFKKVKEFSEEIELPDIHTFREYSYNLINVEKPCVAVKTDSSVLKQRDYLQSNGFKVSEIKNSGLFPMYEKPEEFNKIINDYLSTIELVIEKEREIELRRRNKSLKEFQNLKSSKKSKIELLE